MSKYDKYLPLVYKYMDKYKLPEDCIGELSITMCEAVNNNTKNMYATLDRKAKKLGEESSKNSDTLYILNPNGYEFEDLVLDKIMSRELLNVASKVLTPIQLRLINSIFVDGLGYPQTLKKLKITNLRGEWELRRARNRLYRAICEENWSALLRG